MFPSSPGPHDIIATRCRARPAPRSRISALCDTSPAPQPPDQARVLAGARDLDRSDVVTTAAAATAATAATAAHVRIVVALAGARDRSSASPTAAAATRHHHHRRHRCRFRRSRRRHRRVRYTFKMRMVTTYVLRTDSCSLVPIRVCMKSRLHESRSGDYTCIAKGADKPRNLPRSKHFSLPRNLLRTYQKIERI